MPEPRDAEERWAIPHARKNFRRITNIRFGDVRTKAHDDVFAAIGRANDDAGLTDSLF
jgi:hypothetical protein